MAILSQTELKVVAVAALLLFAGHLIDQSNKQELVDYNKEVKDYFPPPPAGARNLDFNTGQWVMQEEAPKPKVYQYERVIHQDQFTETPSDEEIRIMREKQSYKPGGSYIYTPGRNVPSYEKMHEKAIEKYLDDQGEELYDELRDKYGD